MDVDEMFAIEEEVVMDPEESLQESLKKLEKQKEKKRRWRRKKRQTLRRNEEETIILNKAVIDAENSGRFDTKIDERKSDENLDRQLNENNVETGLEQGSEMDNLSNKNSQSSGPSVIKLLSQSSGVSVEEKGMSFKIKKSFCSAEVDGMVDGDCEENDTKDVFANDKESKDDSLGEETRNNKEVTIFGIMKEVKTTESELKEVGALLGSDENADTYPLRPYSILQENVLAMEFDEGSQDSVIYGQVVQQEGRDMGVQSVTIHHKITYGMEEMRVGMKQDCASVCNVVKVDDDGADGNSNSTEFGSSTSKDGRKDEGDDCNDDGKDVNMDKVRSKTDGEMVADSSNSGGTEFGCSTNKSSRKDEGDVGSDDGNDDGKDVRMEGVGSKTDSEMVNDDRKDSKKSNGDYGSDDGNNDGKDVGEDVSKEEVGLVTDSKMGGGDDGCQGENPHAYGDDSKESNFVGAGMNKIGKKDDGSHDGMAVDDTDGSGERVGDSEERHGSGTVGCGEKMVEGTVNKLTEKASIDGDNDKNVDNIDGISGDDEHGVSGDGLLSLRESAKDYPGCHDDGIGEGTSYDHEHCFTGHKNDGDREDGVYSITHGKGADDADGGEKIEKESCVDCKGIESIDVVKRTKEETNIDKQEQRDEKGSVRDEKHSAVRPTDVPQSLNMERTKQQNAVDKEEGELSSSNDDENVLVSKHERKLNVKSTSTKMTRRDREEKEKDKRIHAMSCTEPSSNEMKRAESQDEKKEQKPEKKRRRSLGERTPENNRSSRKVGDKDKTEDRKSSLSKERKSEKDDIKATGRRQSSNTKLNVPNTGTKASDSSSRKIGSKQVSVNKENKKKEDKLNTSASTRDVRARESTSKSKSIRSTRDKSSDVNDPRKKINQTEDDNSPKTNVGDRHGRQVKHVEKAKGSGERRSREVQTHQKESGRRESRSSSASSSTSTRNLSRNKEKVSKEQHKTQVKKSECKTSPVESANIRTTSSKSSSRRSSRSSKESITISSKSKDLKAIRNISGDSKKGSDRKSVSEKSSNSEARRKSRVSVKTQKNAESTDKKNREACKNESPVAKTTVKTDVEITSEKKSESIKREDSGKRSRDDSSAKRKESCVKEGVVYRTIKTEGNKNSCKEESLEKEVEVNKKGTKNEVSTVKQEMSSTMKASYRTEKTVGKKDSIDVDSLDTNVKERVTGESKKPHESRNRSESKDCLKIKAEKISKMVKDKRTQLKQCEKIHQRTKSKSQVHKVDEEKSLGKRKREDTPLRSKKFRKMIEVSASKESVKVVKTKEAKLPGNVITVRILKVDRGKALVLKRRHVNQMFIRGDNVIMVAHENPLSSQLKL